MNYSELINNISTFDRDEDKLQYLSNYILNNVSYNYEKLCNSKLSKYYRDNEPDDIVDFSDKLQAIQFICDLARQLGLTETYKNEMIKRYGELIKNGKVSFLNIIPTIVEAEYDGDILKKGVCINIAKFFKKVCDDVGISCSIVLGDTGFAHAWNVANVNDKMLHYDCTYAIYAQDKYAGTSNTLPKDWLGITEQQLIKLSPRKIDKYM